MRATARELGRQVVNDAKAADPQGFADRIKLISASPETTAYLQSFPCLDALGQAEGLAATMPTEALAGFTQMLDQGVIEFNVQVLDNGGFSSEVTIHKQEQIQARGFGSLPQCPSAWSILGVVCRERRYLRSIHPISAGGLCLRGSLCGWRSYHRLQQGLLAKGFQPTWQSNLDTG